MRFACSFQHPATGECKSVVATLSAEEIRSVKALGENAEVIAEACALRHAYRQVAEGFVHTEPPRSVVLS
jgi:hypothetical protein